jgi:disulfide oxidoreductase YuzD
LETTRVTEFYLKIRYGDQVEVEYWDLGQPAAQAQHPQVLADIRQRNLDYPVVMVDDEIRLSGSVHYYEVLPLVEEALSRHVPA